MIDVEYLVTFSVSFIDCKTVRWNLTTCGASEENF